jgi:hypothetical protein
MVQQVDDPVLFLVGQWGDAVKSGFFSFFVLEASVCQDNIRHSGMGGWFTCQNDKSVVIYLLP